MKAKAIRYVAYYRGSTDRYRKSVLRHDEQPPIVADYLQGHGGDLVGSFTEVETGERTERPELTKAIEACRRQRAVLLIARSNWLFQDYGFLTTLNGSRVNVRFCDVPDIEFAKDQFWRLYVAR